MTSKHFTINGTMLDNTMQGFLAWAYSDLNAPSNRSALAEYIVAASLNLTKHIRCSNPSNGYGLVTSDGIRIETRAAAYIESQQGDRPDCISFHIAGKPSYRRSEPNVYVFCLYKGIVPEKNSPLNLDLWEFYALPSDILAERFPERRTITLPSLIKLEPIWCDYHGIEEAIRAAVNV